MELTDRREIGLTMIPEEAEILLSALNKMVNQKIGFDRYNLLEEEKMCITGIRQVLSMSLGVETLEGDTQFLEIHGGVEIVEEDE